MLDRGCSTTILLSREYKRLRHHTNVAEPHLASLSICHSPYPSRQYTPGVFLAKRSDPSGAQRPTQGRGRQRQFQAIAALQISRRAYLLAWPNYNPGHAYIIRPAKALSTSRVRASGSIIRRSSCRFLARGAQRTRLDPGRRRGDVIVSREIEYICMCVLFFLLPRSGCNGRQESCVEVGGKIS